MARDGGDLLAHQAGHAPVEELFALLALEVRVRVVEHVLQRPIGGKQLDSRLFADARHAGNVVAGVAHQSLEVGNLLRGDAKVLEHPLRRVAHDLAHAALGVEHAGGFADQLHGVAVARDQQGGNTRLLAAARHRAQDVVRLEAGAGELAYSHRRQAFAHQIKLRAQLRGGRLAPGLVFAVIGMAERRPVQVEGDRQIRGLLRLHDLEQHREKAKNGVGEHAVLVLQRRQRVKCAVHQAVAVDDDKWSGLLHRTLLDDTDTNIIPQGGQKYNLRFSARAAARSRGRPAHAAHRASLRPRGRRPARRDRADAAARICGMPPR